METNILKALSTLRGLRNFSLDSLYAGRNRMNNMGTALEYFVKDAFCGSFSAESIARKDREHSRFLSYIGNDTNPPDFIVKSGDAVEVKKLEVKGADLALNSSYPKDKLFSDNPLITEECRRCEKWNTKDIIYSVGIVKTGEIKLLWFVFGDCYAAARETYERVQGRISKGFQGAEGIEFSATQELGRVNKVDPLGITYLRIRGMWGIQNPARAFNYLELTSAGPKVIAIMREEKFLSFSKADRRLIPQELVRDVQIKNPNNPAKYMNAKAISF